MKKLKNKVYAELIGHKRFEKELRRKDKRERKRKQRNNPTFSWGQSSPLIDYLRENMRGKNVAIYDEAEKTWKIKIPKVFSFLKTPDDVLNVIYSMVKVSSDGALFFDHQEVVEMDLGASALFDVVMIHMRGEWLAKKVKYKLAGIIPDDEEMRDVFICTGLTKHLKIRGMEPSVEQKKSFKQFPLFIGRKSKRSELRKSDQEIAATKIVKHINLCVELAGRHSLSIEGKRQLLKWSGEVISNAEDHSGQNEWFAMAYMRPIIVGNNAENENQIKKIIGECQLTVFGFGKTIYESLSDPNSPQETKKEISRLTEKHKPHFNVLKRYTGMELWTLYALQDGVSRFSIRPGETSRGKGTVEMIEAFQHLGKTLDQSKIPEMSVISGYSRIYFDNKYNLVRKEVQGGTRLTIAFNPQNDLEQKPDSDHVHSLMAKLPGTLLTVKFYIDQQYLEKFVIKK